MKLLKIFAEVVLALFVLLIVVNALQHGNLKTIELWKFKVEFSDKALEHVCFPWWPKKELAFMERPVNKATHDTAGRLLGDWSILGDDGQGGTVLSYVFDAPNGSQISNVDFQRCDGCAHTWVCPEARCGGRPRIEHQSNGPWIAYAATDGAPAATVYYKVTFEKITPRCIF